MVAAVIGTGLAGLACASILREGGEDVVLFDKSKGYGGRMASRRREGFAFDHGLPAFNPVAAETIPAFADLPLWEGHGRVAAPRMNAFPRAIGEAFDSRMDTRIAAIDPDTLDLIDEAGARYNGFARIVVAIPAPQAHELLSAYGPVFAPLAEATYTPCCTLLVGGIAGEATSPVYLTQTTGPIETLIRDDVKPGHPASSPCWVAHANAEWSAANLDRSFEEIAIDLGIAFAALTGLDPNETGYLAAHRWRYSQPEQVVPAPFLLAGDARIGACGDYCGTDRSGGDARAAWRSGAALGRAMLG